MPIEFVRTTAAVFAVLLIAGCSTASQQELGRSEPVMGEATRQTLAAQIIDPDPHYDYADPLTSGAHAAKAIERYRTDTVKQPERIRTSNGDSGGGGAPGG